MENNKANLNDVFASDYRIKSAWFGENQNIVTVGENEVSEIKYHAPLGDGDTHFIDVYYENDNITRQFNPSRIEFYK